MVKTLIASIFALTLIGATAASADVRLGVHARIDDPFCIPQPKFRLPIPIGLLHSKTESDQGNQRCQSTGKPAGLV